MSHSPEPWIACGNHFDDASGITIAKLFQPFDKMNCADVQRLVACVNACRGLPTATLQKAAREPDEKTRLEIMTGELGYIVVDPHS